MLCGELDLAVTDGARSRLRRLAHATATVVVDLSDLQFIDGHGLQLLITSVNAATDNGWQLRIEPQLTRQVRRIVELVAAGPCLWPARFRPARAAQGPVAP